uniref:Uncharacterized protein n=1 Tax=Tanacetum cinerariifolium TaxID=118510 RepID=A0A699HBN7_TANCI|nr:hypothetical protein [Tanacetum cinerariifolium]
MVVVDEEMYDSLKRAATTATGLDAEQDRGIISKTQFIATLNEPSSIENVSGSGPKRQETIEDVATQTRSERLSKLSNDPPLSRVNTLGSGEDRLQLTKLMEICSSRRIKSSNEASLDDQEDTSKQGRIIDNLDTYEGVTLVDETQGRNDQDMFDIGILDDEEVVAEKEVSTADLVTTAGEVVITAGVEVSDASTTLTISMDDI